MRRGALMLLLVMLPSLAAADGEDTRRAAKTTLEKVLDPLPTYDPFTYTVPTPTYFPDKVDKKAHQALIDALMNRPDRVRKDVAYFKAKDKELAEQRGTITGLTHYVKDLSYDTITNREENREKQRQELSDVSSEAQKSMIRARLRHDELEQADSLMNQSRMRQWAALLNRLLGSMDLVNVASGNYMGAAVETAIAELQRLKSPHMPVMERKALALYKRFVEKFPNDPRRQEVLKKIASLSADKKKLWVYEHLKKADEYLDKGDTSQAEFETDLAALVEPEVDGVIARFDEITKMRKRREKRTQKALSVADTDPLASLPKAQAREVQTLLYNLVERDAAALSAQAKRLARSYKGQALGNIANDVEAVAMEIKGEHERAKKELEQVASSSASPRERERAKALLESPEYNNLRSVDEARTQHRLKQVEFVLLGQDLLEKNLTAAIVPIISHGFAGASSLGAANIVMIGSNLLQVLSGNPVSNQDVIDAAGNFIRVRPDSKKAGDVYKILGDAYDSRGYFNKALYYYKLSGKLTAEKIKELEEDAAHKLVQAAGKTQSKAKQRELYTAVLQLYPQTKAANEALGKLSHLVQVEREGIRVSKRFLMEYPELYGPRGLGLKATLFDGNESNMEIADQGLNIVDEGTILLHYDSPWGIQSHRYSVDSAKIHRFETVLREKHYELAALDADRRDEGTPGGFKNLPEILKQLHARRDNVDLRFFRDAAAAEGTYPEVLSHDLLSEKETDPQKGYHLPNIRGSITTSGVRLSGDIPVSFLGDELVIGNDVNSPYAGLRLPIPFLDGFVPIDFMISARPGGPSLTPQIHTGHNTVQDAYLYK